MTTVVSPLMITATRSLDQDTIALTPSQIVGILGKDISSLKVDVFVEDQAPSVCNCRPDESYIVNVGKINRATPPGESLRIICAGNTHYIATSTEGKEAFEVAYLLGPGKWQPASSGQCMFASQLLDHAEPSKGPRRRRIRLP